MSPNLAIATTLQDRLAELGGISAERILLEPPPSRATLDDLLAVNESSRRGLYELVDGTLVEKAMSYEASIVAAAIIQILRNFVSPRRLGIVTGPDGFFRLLDTTRGPDVAFVSRDRLPAGKLPGDPYPQIAPNLAVEVLSPGNTKGEMVRKRIEYFHSGVQVVWIVDCSNRSVAIFTSTSEARVVGETDTIDGGIAIPGFTSPVADFFSDLDIGQPVA